jgi:hypothetical protein
MNRYGLLMGAVSLALAISSGVVTPAAAQEGEVVKRLLQGIGLAPREREPIDYRERAPLVVPPKMTLPPPQAPGTARTAAWPSDPDVVARRAAAAKSRKPVVDGEDGRDKTDAKMTPDELRRVRGAGRATAGGFGPLWGNRGHENDRVNPDELRRGPKSRDEAQLLAPGEEPPRRRLTDPPKGMRRATAVVEAKSEPISREERPDPLKYIREEQKRN